MKQQGEGSAVGEMVTADNYDRNKDIIVLLPLSEEVKKLNVRGIAIKGSTIAVEYKNRTIVSTLYRDDVYKTFTVFDKMVNGSVDSEAKEAIKRCLSANWLESIFTLEPISIQSQRMASVLVRIATEYADFFFKDQHWTPYAFVKMSDHNEVIAIESGKFKRLLAKLFYDKTDKSVPSTDAINNAIQILQAKAEYEGQTIPLSLRVAKSEDDSLYYDLTDDKHRCVKVTDKNWEIVIETHPLFARYIQTAQVEPSRDYEPDVFDKFIELTNIKDESDKLLLKVYIVSLLVPEIAHVMLLLHGEKGSAKSTLQKLIKLLVDPSKPALLTVHSDRNEFIQQCWQNHVVYYDNLKHSPDWLSDEACKAVTGIGSSKRKLFTNSDTIVYEYKRCLGFNGINIMLTEPDALDRSLMIEQQRIPKESRRLESVIYQEFESLKPGLLGYIFDTLVKAKQKVSSIKVDDLPRMADFALWGEAIATAMDYEPQEFINAYYENIGKQNIEAIEYNPLGQAIVKLCDEISVDYYDSMSECLSKLLEVAERNSINTESRAWPKSANWLNRYLNKIRSNLLEGPKIEITVNRLTTDEEIAGKEYKKNTAMIKIRKIA